MPATSANPCSDAPASKAIKLVGGGYFDLERPSQSRFDIRDIAHALAHLCRFTGHTRRFYSVAQHSVLVSHIVPKEHAMEGLMHDAAEAFIGDVSAPLKGMLPDYKRLEERVEAVVFERFGLPSCLPACVKTADLIALRTEQRDLMGADSHRWLSTDEVRPLVQVIEPLPPEQACVQFLERFAQLRHFHH